MTNGEKALAAEVADCAADEEARADRQLRAWIASHKATLASQRTGHVGRVPTRFVARDAFGNLDTLVGLAGR